MELHRRYVEEQVMWQALKGGKMNQMIKFSEKAIKEFVMNAAFVYDETPLICLKQVEVKYNQEMERVIRNQHDILVEVLHKSGISDLPSKLVMQTRSKVSWDPTGRYRPGQSEESKKEQRLVLMMGMERIDRLQNSTVNYLNGIVIVGPPGCGKTFVANLLVTYALTRQHLVMVTALTAQRAREMGGVHLHALFKLPIGASSLTSASVEADNALFNLMNDTIATAVLRKVDMILIDEVGLVSMEGLETIDIILRRVR